jgi:DNA mismatch repair protein MSH5
VPRLIVKLSYRSRQDSANRIADGSVLPHHDTDIRPNHDFSYEGALNKLSALDSLRTNPDSVRILTPGANDFDDQLNDFQPEELDFNAHQGMQMQISALLDLESKISIGCAGAIVSFLARKRTSEYLPGDPDARHAYRISELGMFTLRNTM